MITCTVRWEHPRLGTVTERLCREHGQSVLPALDTLGIVYGYQDTPGDRDCVRCRWDAPYGADGLPGVLVRQALESLVVQEIADALHAAAPFTPGR